MLTQLLKYSWEISAFSLTIIFFLNHNYIFSNLYACETMPKIFSKISPCIKPQYQGRLIKIDKDQIKTLRNNQCYMMQEIKYFEIF